ncbi:hypothetical protein ACOCJ7_00200 [Knoellia sp. CPCC 206453]|uniref:hypothetical protein n=1 Tax=Knoellia pratensis TaxID=3404796 RepID=UPI00360EFB11
MKRLWERPGKRTALGIAGGLLALLTLTACAREPAPAGAEPVPSASSTGAAETNGVGAVEDTVVRFRSGQTYVASADELSGLEGSNITIEVVD